MYFTNLFIATGPRFWWHIKMINPKLSYSQPFNCQCSLSISYIESANVSILIENNWTDSWYLHLQRLLYLPVCNSTVLIKQFFYCRNHHGSQIFLFEIAFAIETLCFGLDNCQYICYILITLFYKRNFLEIYCIYKTATDCNREIYNSYQLPLKI